MLVNLVQEFVCSSQVSRSAADCNFSEQFTFGGEQIASFYPCNPISKHLSFVQKLLSLPLPPIYLMSLVTKTSKLRFKYYTHQTITFFLFLSKYLFYFRVKLQNKFFVYFNSTILIPDLFGIAPYIMARCSHNAIRIII